jgi:hypothetical protein
MMGVAGAMMLPVPAITHSAGKTAAGGSKPTLNKRSHAQRYRQTYELLFGKICAIVRHLCIHCKRVQDENEGEVNKASHKSSQEITTIGSPCCY